MLQVHWLKEKEFQIDICSRMNIHDFINKLPREY